MSAHEQTASAWESLAPRYDKTVTPTHIALGDASLRRAGLSSGMRFLDVAAGSGALSIPAARLGARVLAIDHSPAMLRLLEERAGGEGLDVETRVMDGQELDLDDDSYDMVGSQFGVMLFPDMPSGVREMARVVRPGGRVLMTTLGDPRMVEFFVFFMRAIQTVRPDFTGPSLDPPPLPFQLQDPERLRRELAAAGLESIQIDGMVEPLEFQNGEDLWTWLTSSNPVAEVVLEELNLTNGERAALPRALERLVRERANGRDRAVLTSPINIGIGTKR